MVLGTQKIKYIGLKSKGRIRSKLPFLAINPSNGQECLLSVLMRVLGTVIRVSNKSLRKR